MSPNEVHSSQHQKARRGISGRLIVGAMFFMGICATSFLYTYWTFHLMPFMPLQEAIVQEFPGSAPRVDGGRKKLHKDTPNVLRIVLKSEVDPTSEKPKDLEYLSNLRERIERLSREKVPLPDLDEIELHVYKLVKEEEILECSWKRPWKEDGKWELVDAPTRSPLSGPISAPAEQKNVADEAERPEP
ncbi:MAG: hypothetical protein U0996_01760 [Planctomycetaceae bacterium]